MHLNGDGDIVMIIVRHAAVLELMKTISAILAKMVFISSAIKQKDMESPVHAMIIVSIMDFTKQ